jgi:single-strand DNA-binding protein
MQLLGSREGMGGADDAGGGGGGGYSRGAGGEGRTAARPSAPVSKPAGKSSTGFDDMDDDIPF